MPEVELTVPPFLLEQPGSLILTAQDDCISLWIEILRDQIGE